MILDYCLLLLVFLFKGDIDAVDAGCSLDCCYLYSAFSVNLTCSPSGSPISVTLQCAITLPDLTGVQVRWYRSETEELAGTRGELVDTAAGVTGVLESTPSPFSGLYTAVTSTHIKNFTFRDSGYYWCQLGVNSTCLLPSPPGLVELDSLPQETCDDNSTFANSKQFLSHSPVCALKEGTSFTLGSESTRTEMATFMATAMTGGSGEDEDALWYSVMGVVFFLVAMLSAALTLLVIVRVSRRRAAASQVVEFQALLDHCEEPAGVSLKDGNSNSLGSLTEDVAEADEDVDPPTTASQELGWDGQSNHDVHLITNYPL